MQWAQLSENLKAIGGILLLPYVLYREIKEQILLWNSKGHTPFVAYSTASRPVIPGESGH